MNQETTGAEQETRVPVMQRIMDNPFLLLFIGVVVPTVFYIVWGIMELVSIPVARLSGGNNHWIGSKEPGSCSR